ncbi:MAG: hypothetical protein SNJ82_00320 [Gemmataceae bacterium]
MARKPHLETLEARDCPTTTVGVVASFSAVEGQNDGLFRLGRDETTGPLTV